MAAGLAARPLHQVDVLDGSGAHLRAKQASSESVESEVDRIGQIQSTGGQNWSILNDFFSLGALRNEESSFPQKPPW